MMIKKIMKAAQAAGACSKSEKASDWASLAWLLFSPQGGEFCITHNFPYPTMWSEIKRNCDTTRFGVYIDEDYISLKDCENIALIGRTEAHLHFDRPDKAHRVVMMQGAKATIKATNYAVVNIITTGADCDVTIDKDETSIILW